MATFEGSPTILQRFHKGRLFEHRYWDADSAELKTMKAVFGFALISLLSRIA